MAFSVGESNGGSGRRKRFRGSGSALSEINIIPLVDVVLVLLIIFMLTAHVMDYGLQVDVPKVKITKDSPEILPVVTITRDQTLHLNEKVVNIHDLPAQLAQRFKGQTIVYVAADSSIRWDVLAQVLAELSAAQITPRMVTKPLESKGR
ncbi:MAG TPA: biopolymer transporter ExbD [Bryobacteraceae bacterium]|nr:biopolymer transporter ExbD [Bryobacteraceae bacterium]